MGYGAQRNTPGETDFVVLCEIQLQKNEISYSGVFDLEGWIRLGEDCRSALQIAKKVLDLLGIRFPKLQYLSPPNSSNPWRYSV